MSPLAIERSIDIHAILDSVELETSSQEYYRLNHITPEQKEQLLQGLSGVLEDWLNKVGIKTDM